MVRAVVFHVVTIASLFCVYSNHAQAVLVSHWKFDEGTGQDAQDSVGTNHGTLGVTSSVGTDDPLWDGAGKIGSNSLNFDGSNDFVQVGNPASLSVSAVTMAAWVNVDTTKRNTVFDKQSNTSSGDGLHIRVGNSTSDNLLRSYVGVTGSSNFTTSTGSVPLGMWTHIAMVSNGTTIQTYINGIPDGFANLTSGVLNNSNNFRIGGSEVFGTSINFDGRIDDAGFWNSTLLGSQVRALYTLGSNTSLTYDLGQAQQLFDLYTAASGSVTINGRAWTYTTGLSLGLGDVTQVGSGYFLQFASDGTGVMSVLPAAPEPGSGLLLTLGAACCCSARRRKAIA